MEEITTVSSKVIPPVLHNAEITELSYSFVKRSNVVAVYKAAFEQLVSRMDASLCNTIEAINELVKIFEMLMDIVTNTKLQGIHANALRSGRLFIDKFTKFCLPVLDKKFAAHKVEIIALVKDMQKGTRHMQNLCGRAKELKDATLTSLVPQTKRTLEMFIFACKDILTKHESLSAFWIGNLRHRDTEGRVISSQMPVSSDVSEEEDEETQQPPPKRVSKPSICHLRF